MNANKILVFNSGERASASLGRSEEAGWRAGSPPRMAAPHDARGSVRYSRGAVKIARLICALAITAVAGFAAPADWIWSGRYVVTMDAQRRVIENGAIAIVGDHVAAVGTRAAIDRD